MGSILREEELERYLKKNKQEKQEALLQGYKEKGTTIDSLPLEKRPKAMKALLDNLLDNSRTMKQFLYFLRQLELEPMIVDQKLIGVRRNNRDYILKEIGLSKSLEKKQQAFKEYEARRKEYAKSKEGRNTIESSEMDFYLGGGLFNI